MLAKLFWETLQSTSCFCESSGIDYWLPGEGNQEFQLGGEGWSSRFSFNLTENKCVKVCQLVVWGLRVCNEGTAHSSRSGPGD